MVKAKPTRGRERPDQREGSSLVAGGKKGKAQDDQLEEPKAAEAAHHQVTVQLRRARLAVTESVARHRRGGGTGPGTGTDGEATKDLEGLAPPMIWKRTSLRDVDKTKEDRRVDLRKDNENKRTPGREEGKLHLCQEGIDRSVAKD